MKQLLIAAGALVALGSINIPAAYAQPSVTFGQGGVTVYPQGPPRYQDRRSDERPGRVYRQQRCRDAVVIDRWGNERYQRQCSY